MPRPERLALLALVLIAGLPAGDALADGLDQRGGRPAEPTAVVGVPALLRGPYLQSGTSTSVIVRWRTDIDANSRVTFGPADEPTGGLASGPLAGSLVLELDDATSTTEHEIELTGLIPDTRYYYAVGQFTGPVFELLAGDDAEHFFDTPAPTGQPEPLRVWVLGDSGLGNQIVRDVRDAYEDFTEDVGGGGVDYRHTDLWLMLGDNAYGQGTEAQYQGALFDVFPEMLRKSVLWPVLGNHDLFDVAEATYPYFDIFTLPLNGPTPSSTEIYYSFDYANVHFVMLDSATYAPGALAGHPMLTWLQADLMNTSQQWIVATFHHPPYSKGGHDSDDAADSQGRLVDMRELVVPILESHGVDVVLTGHSHSYERTYLIHGHDGDSDSYDDLIHEVDGGDGDPMGDGPYAADGDGAVYTVSGNASQRSRGVADSLGGNSGLWAHPAMASSLYVYGSVVLDFNGDWLEAIHLDEFGVAVDRYAMYKGAAPPVAPAADFSGSPLSVAPFETVDFSDLSSNGPTTWSWDFDDDGQVDSRRVDPSHQYDAPGSYSVRLGVSNSAGADEMLRDGYVCVSAGAPGAITGLLAQADDQTYSWDPHPLATSYQVLKGDVAILQATGDLSGAIVGCVDSVTEPQVTDTDQPPTGAAFFYVARGASCLPETGTYDGAGGAAPRDLALQGMSGCACPAGDDSDGDDYCDAIDNCPDTAGQDVTDMDGDGLGDICDVCPTDPTNDVDGDTVCGLSDNCPSVSNTLQDDYDGDALGDACDPDDDNDGVEDPFDDFPLDEFRCTDSDNDGCDDCSSGSFDPADDGTDNDVDGICNVTDNCPITSNPGQANADLDGLGDACDPCTDTDGDGRGNPGFPENVCPDDNCPDAANPGQEDFDNDGAGDTCDPCTDTDGDNAGNPGFPNLGCVEDNCPTTPNPGQENGDTDPLGDACDPDDDNDTVPDEDDQEPLNPLACRDVDGDTCDDCSSGIDDPFDDGLDVDGDGLCFDGDACPFDLDNDRDGDTVCGDADNCPALSNLDQTDLDLDGIGDACRFIDVNGFYISALEVTNAEYVEFLNAVADDDPNGLYNTDMLFDERGGLGRAGAPGSYSYGPLPGRADRPVNFVSWMDAARYANWLHNGRPTGPQGPGTTETGAYDMVTTAPAPPTSREAGAVWFLPDQTEWDTAAYSDPPRGPDWTYPTRSDVAPTLAQASHPGSVSNPGFNIANYDNGATWQGIVGHHLEVGGAGPMSASHWGTYDQAGNLAEWVEDDAGGGERRVRGGSFADPASELASSATAQENYDEENARTGIRIAATAGCVDLDGDGWGLPWTPGCAEGPALDNCPGDYNPAQVDSDGDGLGNACDGDNDNDGVDDPQDCLPLGAGVSSEPGDVGPTLTASKQAGPTLHWLRGLQGHTTNIYSGTQLAGGGFPALFSCALTETPATDAPAGGAPTAGAVVFYLASAKNACGESAPGQPVSFCITLGAHSDADGITDVEDNCALDDNLDQADGDGDFVGDACDNCPATFNPNQADTDGDMTGDACEI